MSQRIAILGGTGKLGQGLALWWAAQGQIVIIGSRRREHARQVVEDIQARLPRPVPIEVKDYAGAAAAADIVVLTVPYTAQIQTVKSIRKSLRPSAIVVDTTVPLAAGIGGKTTQTIIPWPGSAAQQIAELMPDQVRLVAALHTIAAERLAQWPNELDGDVLVTGDDPDSKATVSRLIEKIPRLRAVDVGPLELARITEQLAALLISVNRNHRVRGAGIRITGLDRDSNTGRP